MRMVIGLNIHDLQLNPSLSSLSSESEALSLSRIFESPRHLPRVQVLIPPHKI